MNIKATLNVKLLSFMLSGFLALSLASTIVFTFAIKKIVDINSKSFFGETASLSTDVQDQFYERYGDVKAFALRFVNVNQSATENKFYLNQYAKLYGIYDLILICDLKGNFLAANDQDPSGKNINIAPLIHENYAKELWFKNVIEKKYLEDKQKGFEGVGFVDGHFDPALEKVYGKKIFANIFSTYVYNEKGEPYAIISTHTNFSWIDNLIKRSYEGLSQKNYRSVETILIDKYGTILEIYSPSDQNYDLSFLHDEKILNHVNLVKEQDPAAQKLQSDEEGTINFFNQKKGIDQLSSFVPIKGDKIVDDLGWKIIMRVSESEFYKDTRSLSYIIFSSFGIILILTSIFFGFYIKTVTKKFLILSKTLSTETEKFALNSGEMSNLSNQLSTTSTQHASAVQETASAVTQINSMINRTIEVIEKSKVVSNQTKQEVSVGQSSMELIIQKGAEIKHNSEDVLHSVQLGNERIGEIVGVIAEIGNKTKVINEIVFQTKLLSFNASVEAARAGEHGKGFAVVAEEVGNLAQMSGNAAKEISSLLDGSVEKVKKIIEETTKHVEQKIREGNIVIKESEGVSGRFAEIFKNILENTEKLNGLVTDISSSAEEQARGIGEITKAMQQLDTVTHQNSMSAQKISSFSNNIHDLSSMIQKVSIQINNIITGDKTFKKGKDNNKIIEEIKEDIEASPLNHTPSSKDNRFKDF